MKKRTSKVKFRAVFKINLRKITENKPWRQVTIPRLAIDMLGWYDVERLSARVIGNHIELFEEKK